VIYRWCTDEQLAVIQRRSDELHAALRRQYEENGMALESVAHKDLQAALDAAAALAARTGTPIQVNLQNYTGSALVKPPKAKPRASPEKEIAALPERRIGDARRNEYTDHLSFMFQGGYISQSDFSARMGRAAEALTEHDLLVLIQDLPPLSEGKRMLPEAVKEEKYRVSPAFGFSAAAMAMLTVLISLHFPGSGDLAAVLAFSWMIAFSGFAWITRKKKLD